MNPDTSECKQPWLFWWALLPREERKELKKKYFAKAFPMWYASLLDEEKQEVWENEKPEPLREEDWLELATKAIHSSQPVFSQKEQKEIWRQVYRIASERI